jgi:GNAT superfamily N-acetyltransferase
MIRRMTRADIPGAMRLKEAAGWNQTEQDWQHLLALEPEGCWVFEASRPPAGPGTIAGSTTVVCFGKDLAWVGMVLVLPEFRGQGIARLLMEQALRFTAERKIQRVALDATDFGKPLYRKLGFEDEALIERWEGLAPPANPDGRTREAEASADPTPDVAWMARLDRSVFGADRRALLELLVSAAPQDCFTAPQGYLLARPGSKTYFLGPCAAENPGIARMLVQDLLQKHAGRRFCWDLPAGNHAAVEIALSLGFQRARTLTRMSRPAVSGQDSLPRTAWMYAAAGFEYG